MNKNFLIIVAVGLVAVSVYLLWRQSVEQEKYYKATGESFMYKYGGNVINLFGKLIDKKKGK